MITGDDIQIKKYRISYLLSFPTEMFNHFMAFHIIHGYNLSFVIIFNFYKIWRD